MGAIEPSEAEFVNEREESDDEEAVDKDVLVKLDRDIQNA